MGSPWGYDAAPTAERKAFFHGYGLGVALMMEALAGESLASRT